MGQEDLIEIATDENGVVIWEKPYDRQRELAPGDTIAHEDVRYRIVSMTLKGATVRTRLERNLRRK